MIDIGAQLTNSKKKLRMSPGTSAPDPDGKPIGLGLACCEANLRTIAKKLRIIRASMERMADYYSETRNGEAMGILGQMDMRLDQLSTGAGLFAQASSEAMAYGAMQGLIRPWNEFRNGVQSLRLCCPIPIPVDEGGDESGETTPSESRGE
jgi:hypothetical protein